MKPITRILVPTDFSDGATRALKYAVHLAKTADAKLILLHAYRVPNPVMVSPYPVAIAYPDADVDYEKIEQEVTDELEALRRDHVDKAVKCEIISVCDLPEEAIASTTRERSIDLIVMGMRGGGALDKLVGSTTTNVMHRVTCPLIAVPINAVFAKIDHILLAIDYERIKRADTFQILVTLANIFRAQIDVLHVTPGYTNLSPEKIAAGDMLDRMLRHARHSYRHQTSANILDGLRSYLREHDEEIGMLAMIPRDHNVWERITKGSVTKDILFEADRPVFVQHA